MSGSASLARLPSATAGGLFFWFWNFFLLVSFEICVFLLLKSLRSFLGASVSCEILLLGTVLVLLGVEFDY